MSLGIVVNKNKIGALLAYLTSRVPNVSLRKLIKLVYKVDEVSVVERGIPITWLDYYAWCKGPVAPEIYDIKYNGGEFKEYVQVSKNNEGKVIVSVNPNYPEHMQEFSQCELEMVNQVINLYGDKSADDLFDDTHVEGSLWSNVMANKNIDFTKTEGKSDILISLSNLIVGDENKLADYEEAEENMLFRKALMAG